MPFDILGNSSPDSLPVSPSDGDGVILIEMSETRSTNLKTRSTNLVKKTGGSLFDETNPPAVKEEILFGIKMKEMGIFPTVAGFFSVFNFRMNL